MDIRLRIAHLAAIAAFSGPLVAESTLEPCGKNHYILDEPCTSAWSAANDGLADLDIRVVATDPIDAATLYAGGRAGVFKSIDGGASWTMSGLAMTTVEMRESPRGPALVAASSVAHIAIDQARAGTLYAATVREESCIWWQRRVFKSVDGGATWSDNASPGINGCDNIHSLALAPTGTLFATNFDDFMGDSWSPLVRSTDGATSWDYLGYPVLNVLGVDPSRSGTLYAGTFDFEPYFTSLPNGVVKSVDGGATWAPTGLTGMGITALRVDPTLPLTIYAAASHSAIAIWGKTSLFKGLYKTVDGGVQWNAIDNGLEHFVGSASAVVAIVVDPEDSNVVYVAMSEGGVWRSSDGGATWLAFNAGLEGMAIRSLALAAGKPNTLYVGTASGVFRITDFPR